MAWQKESGPVSAEVAAASEAAAPAATVVGNVVAWPAPEQVANYVRSLTDFTMEPSPVGEHDHMGAIIAEAILQAGINYRNVVLPRVRKLRDDYPDARTTSGFAALLLRVGTAELLQYSGEKVERVEALTQLLLDEQVETKADL